MNPNREELLFQLALTKPAAERGAWLDRECGEDKALRHRLEALLAAHDEPDVLSPKAAPALVATVKMEFADVPDEAVGQTLGRYKLLERLGEGGCGVVYVAEQTQPVRRRVALKVIKLGMDTKQVVARFEAERQALAMMDHPNIAKVLDAGTTGVGRPYFVMELVRGIRITDYCDQNNLTTQERLDLFIKVCHAIQHAHQKGIIHRDIKPSNILVTLHDGVPVPKVIDFGIAKATEGRLTDATVYTQLHQFIGTPAYMSPEQAEMSGLDIDTRSDIYSLGVLLYELLAGSTPFDARELMSQGIDAMRKTIREKEPMRPSTRFATLEGEELTTTAKRRSADKSKVIHQLKGDLDWIVMKCLEKDRTRRYETANGLASDLKRHLGNEPVLACPPSAAYRFQKSFRRNRLMFTAGAAVAAALVLGILMSVWQAARAQRETKRAVAALDELRASAPAFVAEARSLAAREQFNEAIARLDYAIKLRPDVPEYRVAKGDLLQCQFKLAEAAPVYREALRLKPGLARAEASARLCEELLAAPPDKDGKLSRESLARLNLAMQQQQRPAAELMPVARLLGEANKLLTEYWTARLTDLPISAERPLKERLTAREDGLLALDLSGTKIADLTLLAGMPLGSLNVTDCKQIKDFAPLHQFRALKELRLQSTGITDLSPLGGLPLEDLNLTDTQIFDLAVLRGMKLKKLSLWGTRVADLSPLAGMPLTFFDATTIPATDYSPLAGAPLEICLVQDSPVRDLSFLRGSPVQQLILGGSQEARGYALLDGLKSLNLLILPSSYRSLPAEDLAAIAALRNHPALRNIDSSERRSGNWVVNTAESREDFWKSWDGWQALTKVLRESGFKSETYQLADGKYKVIIRGQPLSDLSFLKDAPIEDLVISQTSVSDLRPLEQLPLTHLDIRQTSVSDLTPLRAPVLSASLRQLELWRIPATDFSPVAACTNLEWFDAAGTALADLEVLRGRNLHSALLSGTQVTDISVLAGMPLERVTLNETAVTNLAPLLQCPTLTELVLPRGAINVSALHALPKLAKISYELLSGGYSKQTAADFWLGYTHGGMTAADVSVLAERSLKTPQDGLLAMKVAALQAWFGLDADYAATCTRMIEAAGRAAKTEDVRERAAKNWCLRASNDAAMLPRVLALAREAAQAELHADQRPWYQQTLGMAEFRAGDDAAAEAAFLRAGQAAETGSWHPEWRAFIHAPCGFYRAMVLFRKGRANEAKALFEEARAQMPPLPADAAHALPVEVSQDQLLCWLAYKEASALLKIAPSTKP